MIKWFKDLFKAQPIPICRDCVYFVSTDNTCVHETSARTNVVTGVVLYFPAILQRRYECGIGGKYFESKHG